MAIEDEFDKFLDDELENEKKQKQIEKENNYRRSEEELKESVSELQGNINSMLKEIDSPINDMTLSDDMLPSLEIKIEQHDYDRDIELIKIEAKETLESLVNLYLDEDTMKNKNIYKIIKDDSIQLADLNFSIAMSKRALISCMTQLDMGVSDPEMYKSVALFQKELRDTIKMAYDLQKKMKEFYKELKDEVPEINTGLEQIEDEDNDTFTIIGDPKLLNDLFDKYKDDPTFLGKDVD